MDMVWLAEFSTFNEQQRLKELLNGLEIGSVQDKKMLQEKKLPFPESDSFADVFIPRWV